MLSTSIASLSYSDEIISQMRELSSGESASGRDSAAARRAVSGVLSSCETPATNSRLSVSISFMRLMSCRANSARGLSEA